MIPDCRIEQMQLLCGVANLIASPEGALSPEGKARGWQSCVGIKAMFYYTEQHTTQSCDIFLPHFLKAACFLGCCYYCKSSTHKSYDERSMSFSLLLFWTIRSFHCPRRHFAQALTYFRHAWGSWKHDVLNNIGNDETVGLQFTAPSQRVPIRWIVTAVKEPTEKKVLTHGSHPIG